MGCFSGTNAAPKQPTYPGVTAATLSAQTAEAPQLFAAESDPNFGQPAYANLSLENLNTLLYGTPGGSSTESYDKTIQSTGGWYDAQGNFISNQRSARPSGATWYGNGKIFQVPTTATINQPATRGLLADTQDVLHSDPNINALLGRMNSQAIEGLDAGAELTPEQQHMVEQMSLAGFAKRGTSGSSSSVVDSIMNRLNYGQELEQYRRQFAGGVLGANESAYLNPLVNILGRQLAGGPTGPSLYNPQAGIPLAQSNYNTAAQFAAAQPTGLQNTAALVGLGGQALGATAGAIAAI